MGVPQRCVHVFCVLSLHVWPGLTLARGSAAQLQQKDWFITLPNEVDVREGPLSPPA